MKLNSMKTIKKMSSKDSRNHVNQGIFAFPSTEKYILKNSGEGFSKNDVSIKNRMKRSF